MATKPAAATAAPKTMTGIQTGRGRIVVEGMAEATGEQHNETAG